MLVGLPRHPIEAAQVIEVDELLVVDELRLLLGQLLGNLVGQRLLACHELGVSAKQDVRAAARHVGRDRDRPAPAGLRDDLGLLLVVLGVQDDVLDAAQLQQFRQPLRLLDRHGADERRAALLLLFDDVGDDRLVFFFFRPVDGVGLFDAPELAVGRDDHHFELVDLVELFGFGVGRAGHPRQLAVLAEVILEGHRRERLVLALDLDLLLGLDRLMKTIAPTAAGHQPSGELVDDHDAVVLDHVLDVELEERVRPECLRHVMEQRHVRRVVQPARTRHEAVAEHPLGLGHSGFGQRDGLVLLVDDIVAGLFELVAILGLDVPLRDGAGRQLRDDAVDLVIEIGRFLGWPRDDQRRSRFVDEDAVDLVDDRVVVTALHVVREVELHVVAEVVETELVVRAVGDIAGVRDLAFLIVEVMLDDANRHPKEPVDAAHPFRVATREVVVDRDDMDALALERIEVGRKGRDERLALAGLHLGDLAAMEDDAADQLHVEVPHVQHAAAGLADDGKGFRNQIVKRRAATAPAEPLPEFGGLRAQRVVGQALDLGFLGVDFGDERPNPFQLAIVRGADDFREEGVDNHAGDDPLMGRLTLACTVRAATLRVSTDCTGRCPWGQLRDAYTSERQRGGEVRAVLNRDHTDYTDASDGESAIGQARYLAASRRMGFVSLPLTQIS